MRPYARIRHPDGALHDLGHGDIIGRLWSAALQIHDPRVSEAHAMVSLRGEALRLLALRGRFAIDHAPATDVELVPGLRVELAQDLAIEVVEVVLPEEVLAIEGAGLPRLAVPGVCSLTTRPRPSLTPGFRGDAEAWLWSDGDGFRLRHAGHPARPLLAGDRFEVGGQTFTAVAVSLSRAGFGATRVGGGVTSPLRILARYDSVHIHRGDALVVRLSGQSARILSELVSCALPLSWEALARDLWPDETDAGALRRRWDVCMTRLRGKLRAARIRPDLVRPDGCGHVELVLYPGDIAFDDT